MKKNILYLFLLFSLTFLFTYNVGATGNYRYITKDDIEFTGGVSKLFVANGTIVAPTYETFSIIKLDSDITYIKGITTDRLFLVYKDNGNGTYNCLDSGGKMYTLTPGSTNVTSLGTLSNFTKLPTGLTIGISLENGVLTIKDGSTTYATISDSNMIGFWSSAEPDVMNNVMLKSIQVSGNSVSSDVNTFTVYSDHNYTINEEFIYNAFKAEYSDFTLEEFPYITCSYRYSTSQTVGCSAMTKDLFDSLILDSHQSTYKYYNFKNNEVTASTVGFSYHIYDNTFSMGSSINVLFPYYSNSVITYDLHYGGSHYKDYTNFNPSLLPGVSSDYDTKLNKLNFNRYNTPLTFNENLFANDENFKKVCVNERSSFSITKNHSDGIVSGSEHDFIWFPYGITGIKQFNYSTEMSNGYYEFEDPYENFYFSSYEDINAIWNTEYMKDNFESKGYTDKYKYYGYTAYLFLHWYNFNDGQTYNFFPIFELTDNVTTTHISSSGNIHGGGGTRLDGDEEIEISNEYCFYIKNEYEVNEVILDEWGDHYVSVNTPNGPINYGTTINKDKTDSESFLSQPIKFISEMSGTITFLNANIYNLYMSMPLVVRTFLITALIILIVMLIMKLGGYQ